MWYGNDENKHDKVTFQLAAVDLNSSTFMVRNVYDRHRILKDNSWMCILHLYDKASGLKLCTAMCLDREEVWDNYYFINSRWHRFSPGDLAVVKEYEIIRFKYNGKA